MSVETKLLSERLFFAGIPAAGLEALGACASRRLFLPGDFLIRQGATADAFIVLLRGLVSVELHAPGRGALTLQTLGPEDVLGWSWLVAPYVWSFDGRALEPGEALVFEARALRAALDKDHELGRLVLQRLVGVMAGRLQAARVQLLDLYEPAR